MSEAKIVLTAVDQTKAALESAKRNIASIGDTVARATSLMGPLAAGVLTTAGGIQHLSKALETMDLLDEMAEKTGVSVEALSRLRFAGESVGTTTEQLGGGMRKLAKLMGDAAGGSDEAVNIFKTMGVSFKDASGNLRDTDKVLEDMAERFAGWQDGPAKAALAMKVFGKSGEDMIPMLNLGKQGLSDAATEAERLGITLGGDAAKAAAEFNDNMKKLSLTSEAAGMSLMSRLLPSLMEVSQELLAGIKNADGFMDAIITMGTINPFKTQAENIRSLSDELRELENERSAYSSKAFSTRTGMDSIDADIARTKKQLGYLRELEAIKALSGAGDTGDAVSRRFMRPQTKTAAPIVEKKDASKVQSDFGANFINQLTNQYANLTSQMSKVEEVQRMLEVSGSKFTRAEREKALQLAASIDAWARDKKAIEDNVKAYEIFVQQNDALGQSMRDLIVQRQDIEFKASLADKPQIMQDRLIFEKQVNDQINKMYGDLAESEALSLDQRAQKYEEITRLKMRLLEAFDKAESDQLDKQNNALRGLSDGMREYWEEVQKYGNSTRNAVISAFSGMEDAMVNFVKTGKLDFKSLADSIISDLIRIAVQQSITGPLAQMMGAAMGGGGYSGMSNTNSNAGTSTSVLFANGGVMSSGGELPLHAYSKGGIADSPRLAIFGEGRMNEAYVPLPDGRTIPVTMTGGGGANLVVNVVPTSGQTADVQQRQNSDGTTTIDVILRQVQDGLADGVANGSGSLFNAIGSRFAPRGAQ